jgi:hypothetical protein
MQNTNGDGRRCPLSQSLRRDGTFRLLLCSLVPNRLSVPHPKARAPSSKTSHTHDSGGGLLPPFPDAKRLWLHEVQPPAAARAVRFAAKSAPAGQRQIRAISARNVRAGHSDDTSLRRPPPAAPAKDGFGRFTVSAACGADLVCLYRAPPPPSTPCLWYRPIVAVPIPPSPATRGRRA